MKTLRSNIIDHIETGNLPPPILRQLRFDIVDVLRRSTGEEAMSFKSVVDDMLDTLIRVFEHDYKRSRNPKITVKEYDPLVFTRLYNGD